MSTTDFYFRVILSFVLAQVSIVSEKSQLEPNSKKEFFRFLFLQNPEFWFQSWQDPGTQSQSLGIYLSDIVFVSFGLALFKIQKRWSLETLEPLYDHYRKFSGGKEHATKVQQKSQERVSSSQFSLAADFRICNLGCTVLIGQTQVICPSA